jgi:hypothetical protein
VLKAGITINHTLVELFKVLYEVLRLYEGVKNTLYLQLSARPSTPLWFGSYFPHNLSDESVKSVALRFSL